MVPGAATGQAGEQLDGCTDRCGVIEYRCCGAGFDDPTVTHDQYAVGDVVDDAEVVGDEQIRQRPEPLLQIGQ